MRSRFWPSLIFFLIVTVAAYIMMYIELKNPALTTEKGGVVLTHVPRESYREKNELLISASLFPFSRNFNPTQVYLYYRESKEGEFKQLPMTRLGDSDRYLQLLPGQLKGKKSYYFVEARAADNIRLRLPEDAPEGKQLFFVRWQGETSRWLLYSHIFLMVAAFLTWMHAFFWALEHVMTGQPRPYIYHLALSATVIFFITGFPLGFLVAKQAFGTAWTGVPFGLDITDNKTLITFLYWAIVLIPFRKNSRPRVFSYLVLLGTALTLVVFMVPHSI